MRLIARVAALVMLSAPALLGGCSSDPDPDPCEAVTCSDHGTCEVEGGAATCECEAGYSAHGLTCTADTVDECATGADNCDANATCTDTDDAFTCACNTGFTGDGVTCTADAVDECATGADNCDANATCTDTDDAFTCACNTGFTGDGVTCTADAIDECATGADNCDANATCTDTADAFTCACNTGFTGDGVSCIADGEACDPDADTTACTDLCVPLGDGGACADLCDETTDCPAGWRCDPEYADDGRAGLCLPNASCGAITLFGSCDGTTVSYCGYDGPVTFDCATESGPSGAPKKCGLVSADIGYDCVSADFTGGCGEVSTLGTCTGDVLRRCDSQANGTITTVDCAASGLVCSTANGPAECITSGATGCGAVTATGTCEGATATWCEDYAVSSEDCSATGKICGASGANFRCVTASVASGSHQVSGSFVFEKKALTSDGLGAISNQPVRGALVTVRSAADDSKLAEGYTGQDGSYSLQFDGDGEAYVLVTAQGEPGKHNHSVYDCPMDDCGDSLGNLYGQATPHFTPSADTELDPVTITVASGSAGAFNIFDVYVKGADFAKANMGQYPPVVAVEWKAGSGTEGGTSYFSGGEGKIHVLGGPDDSDEYDDPVLLHEYGHYLEFYLSHSDSPGGDHDGSKTDPRLAFGEGYGTYIGCAIAESPLYIDTSAGGASVEDVRIAGQGYEASLTDSRQMKQLMSEYLISQILWTIATGPNGVGGKTHAPTLDVFANYFTRFPSSTLDRGVEGVELVDFLDGWFCRQHGDRPFIQAIVNGTAMFPYDYAGPATCN